MQSRYITWIHSACEHYECALHTAQTAIELFIRFHIFAKSKKECTYACIMVSSKWYDDIPIRMSDIRSQITYNNIEPTSVVDFEFFILQKIQYSFEPTLYDSALSIIYHLYPMGNDMLCEVVSYLIMLSKCTKLSIDVSQCIITAHRLLTYLRFNECQILPMDFSESEESLIHELPEDYTPFIKYIAGDGLSEYQLYKLAKIHYTYARNAKFDFVFVEQADIIKPNIINGNVEIPV